MKYELQKKHGHGPNCVDPFPRVQGQLNDLRAEANGLVQEAKALRTEVLELRSGFTVLSKRVDALQGETAEIRRELGLVAQHVSEFNGHLESMTGALQQSHSALSATAQALEAEREREVQQQAEIREAFRQQQQEQADLSVALQKSRQQICEQLALLAQKESQLQQNASEMARTLVKLIQKADQQTRERLGNLCGAVLQFAQAEQGSINQMAGSFQKVLDCEKNLSDTLVGVNAALNNLTHHSEQILVEDRQARSEHQRTEAARLNRLGLRCLADGRCDEAVRKFEQAGELAPEVFEAGFNLTAAQLRQGNVGAASKLVDDLTRDFPGRPEVRSLRGLISLAAGDFAAARAALGPLAEADTQDERVQAAAGLACLLSGDAKAAGEAIRRAAQLTRSENQFLLQVGFQRTATA